MAGKPTRSTLTAKLDHPVWLAEFEHRRQQKKARVLRRLDEVEENCNTVWLKNFNREFFEKGRQGVLLEDRLARAANTHELLVGQKIAQARRSVKRDSPLSDQKVAEVEELHRQLNMLLTKERDAGLASTAGGRMSPHWRGGDQRADCVRYIAEQEKCGLKRARAIERAMGKFGLTREYIYRILRQA